MFFRDTRLCVSARAAREPSTSPWVKERSHGFCAARGRERERESHRRGNTFANIFSPKFCERKFKGRIDRIGIVATYIIHTERSISISISISSIRESNFSLRLLFGDLITFSLIFSPL